MYFLIDYENVNHSGLEGFDRLKETDTIVLFYSETCEKMRRFRLDQLLEANCDWEIYELMNAGKNALDFYIASKVSEIITTDPEACIGIVSKDKGFSAVKDYWRTRLVPPNRLVQGESVSVCMGKGFDETVRRSQVRAENEAVSISETYRDYLLCKHVESAIVSKEEEDGDTFCGVPVSQIIDIMKSEKSQSDLYRATIKAFGRKTGLEIYNIIKYMHIEDKA